MIMAFVVLLSSTGFGLVEHSCVMQGKSVALAAMSSPSSGCHSCVKKPQARLHESSQPVFKKKACCEENQKLQKLEVVTSISAVAKILKGSPQTDAISPEDIRFHSSFLPFVLSPSKLSFFPPFFSKFYGRTMLSFVQSFLI